MAGTPQRVEQFVVETCRDSTEWNSFLERNDGPAFALWGWGDAVETYGLDRRHLAVRDRSDDTVLGVLGLFHLESRLFGSQLLSPAFAERGAITLGDHQEDAVRRLLLDSTKRMADDLDVDFVSLRGSTVAGTDGFETNTRYVTFQSPVDRPSDRVWDDVKDSRKRQIEQAADDPSLEYRIGTSLSDLREYYRLYLESMRGHGSPPHSFAFFETLWEELHDAGNLHLGLVTRDGSAINGTIDLSSGSTVYQWGVVTDYEYRDLNGGSWLLWKSLQRAAEEGYDTYEFGRTREGSGVYTFKKSFGGSKTWYDDLHYFPGEATDLPDPENETYELAKRVWRRLPIPVTRVLGPRVRKRIGL